MKTTFKLRAHHGMCLAFFVGKGYSSSFVENMWNQKEYLDIHNPVVQIVCESDRICAKCPHNKQGCCTSMEKVEGYDKKVIEACSLEEGATMDWRSFSSLVQEKIIKTNKRKQICTDCIWNSLCEEIGKNL
ncbi:MAG: DUF1284 domain-containing protein [Firmicutes bacterium]|nr:DUF1284 domain-containing protein [Bacillota bacterium]